MSIAHEYSRCFWNASGDFECQSSTINKKALVESIKSHQNGIPKPSQYKSINSPSDDYARIPQDFHADGAKPNSRSCHNHFRSKKNDNLHPLSRELEVSIYTPDRDNQYPWQEEAPEHIPEVEVKVHQHQHHNLDPGSQMDREVDLKIHQDSPYITLPPNMMINQMGGQRVEAPSYQMLLMESQNPINAPMTLPNLNLGLSGNVDAPLNWNPHCKYETLFQKKKINKYYFQLPIQKYSDLVEEFGKPTLINPKRGGMAIWQSRSFRDTPYYFIKRIDLLDEQCYNNFPMPHIGYLYAYIKIEVPMSKISNIISLCGDMIYDPIKHLLIIRGMTLNYCLAILGVVCRYTNNELSWYNILNEDSIRKALHYRNLINPILQKRNLKTITKYLVPKIDP